jgi:hypothetical protein
MESLLRVFGASNGSNSPMLDSDAVRLGLVTGRLPAGTAFGLLSSAIWKTAARSRTRKRSPPTNSARTKLYDTGDENEVERIGDLNSGGLLIRLETCLPQILRR